jgi:serine/threonine protein kinase
VTPVRGQAPDDDADEGSAQVELPSGDGAGVEDAGRRSTAPPPRRQGATVKRLKAALATRTGPGSTVQLGIDYLTYARAKLSPPDLKKELENRLVPAVGRGPSPAVGAPFGKFEVRSFLGKGGMAEVFLAYDNENKHEVALKVMRDEIALDPAYVRRFLREAGNVGFVDHENVVKVLEVGAVLGRLYFTMEALSGETLKDRLAQGPCEEAPGLRLVKGIVAGLCACHERGISHRDLKPSNVMLVPEGSKHGFTLEGETQVQVKLMDFGLARQLEDDDDPELEAKGRILGTAKYVAPELIAGRKPSVQSDLFSLGILCFQVFSGHAPFRAKEKTDFLEANLHREAPPLESVAHVSPEVSRLVAALLEKDPEDRPTARSLLKDLARLGSRRPNQELRVADDPTSVFYTKREARLVKKRREREPRARASRPLVALTIIVGLVLTLLILAIVVQLARDEPPERASEPGPVPSLAPQDSRPKPVASTRPAPLERPRDPDGLERGRAPSSLAHLVRLVGDPSRQKRFLESLGEGDRAWTAGRYAPARDAWRDGLDLLGPNAELQSRVFRAEREDALEHLDAEEAQGHAREALLALELAVEKGAPAASLELRRLKLKERVDDETAWRDALAESGELAKRGDSERALERLKRARETAQRLHCEAEYDSRVAALEEERRNGESTAQARALVEKARGFLDAGELDAAAMALRSARILSPDTPGLGSTEIRLAHVKNAPPGMVWIELDAGGGLYVKKTPVTNRELKAWIDASPPGKRRPGPWISGGFPDEQADEPVRGVRLEDAKAYADAQRQRLPTAEERATIAKALRLSEKESVPDARGTFGAGFRTVADAP